MSNVQCLYESPSDDEPRPAGAPQPRPAGAPQPRPGGAPEPPPGGAGSSLGDHNYDATEPPAFVIRQVNIQSSSGACAPYVQIAPKIMTIGPSLPAINVIHVSDAQPPSPPEPARRVRRSEQQLREAADCVRRGATFQTVSDRYRIPISTIRFFMARKGILPRRRRGRSGLFRNPSSPEPPFYMQHYRLPELAALKQDCAENT